MLLVCRRLSDHLSSVSNHLQRVMIQSRFGIAMLEVVSGRSFTTTSEALIELDKTCHEVVQLGV